MNDVTHLGGGGSAKRGRYSISLFSKMDDKGKGGVKNLQKLVTSFMDGPKCKIKILLLADENAQRIGFKNIPHLLLYMSDEQINLKKLIT